MLDAGVPTSSPMTPSTTTSAPSTMPSAHRASPWKLGSPGTSRRLILRSCQFACASVSEIDIARFCSSSSQSLTVLPASIVPSLLISSVWYSNASTSDVLPVPRWPTTATLRILPGSMAAIREIPPRDVLDATESRTRPLARAGGATSRRAAHAAGEAGLEAQHRLRVQLRDARLRDADHLADLAEGELLVVVERDDELLALRQAGDRLAERLAHLGLLERELGIGFLLVLDRVDEGDRSPLPEGDQSSSSAAIEEREISERLLSSSAVVIPTFAAISSSVGGRCSCRSSSTIARSISRARVRPSAVPSPASGARRSSHPRCADRIRLVLDLAVGVEALDRADEADSSRRRDPARRHGRAACAEAPGDELDERAYARINRSCSAWSCVRRSPATGPGSRGPASMISGTEYAVTRESFLRMGRRPEAEVAHELADRFPPFSRPQP